MAIYKKTEFKAFLKSIKWGSTAHWIDIAEAIGIDKNTVTAWKNLPESQAAIQEGIDRAFAAMEQSGSKDWRMWEAKLKMLGVNPPSKLNVDINDPRREILDKYMGNKDAGKAEEAESRSSIDTT